jgi:hypothetical protein
MRFEFGLNLFGFQTFGKNLNNSPKFYLAKVFMNVNLYGLTSLQNFDDITQVTIYLDLLIKGNSNFNTNLN